MAEQQDRARDAAVAAVVYNAIAMAVQLGVLVAIAKRDTITRQAARVRSIVRQEWRTARAERMAADLRRDISRMEHEGVGGDGD